jgi:hypothetical protein
VDAEREKKKLASGVLSYGDHAPHGAFILFLFITYQTHEQMEARMYSPSSALMPRRKKSKKEL